MKAIVLLSGGLDSTVMLAIALKNGRSCHAISFDYGQRNRIELESAKKITNYYQVPHKIIKIDSQTFSNSSLVSDLAPPTNRTLKQIEKGGIPNTYVPARNTLFLSYAICQAELFQADEIYFGPNALDRIPYPDCRKEFTEAFQALINVSTKQAIEGHPPNLVTPLINWDKKTIIEQGMLLKVPIEMTFSCYDPIESSPCGKCDACVLRDEALNFAIGSL